MFSAPIERCQTATRALAALALFVTASCGGDRPSTAVAQAAQAAPATPEVATVWNLLTTRLPGTWEAHAARGTVRVSYRLVSSESALVETYRTPSGKETLSVYHRHGPFVMLTHYCAQTNQPRLRATAIRGLEVRFDYQDATDVDPEEAVLHARTLTFRPEGFEQSETYRASDGREEPETLHFVRAESDSRVR